MASDPRDYRLDLTGPPASPAPPATDGRGASRPFLSVRFACCNTFARIYRNAEATQYVGRCPRCGQSVRFAVGHGGTSSRFFVVE